MPQDEESILARAWADWCNELRETGEGILAGDANPSDKAEGLRWLTRLTRYGLEAGVEFSDPAFPVFYKPTHETVKVMSDNPDAIHWMATIRDGAEYVLHGTRGTNPRIMFTTLARKEGGGMVQQSGFDSNNMQVEPDGTFRIHVSQRPQAGNWIELKEGAQSLLARALFTDRKTEIAPTLSLEEVGGASAPPPLDAATFARRLDMARSVALGTSRNVRRYVSEMLDNGWVNSFGDKVSAWSAGDPGVHYWHGTWALVPEEALVIDMEPGECAFWNFQVNNRWAESLDYLHRKVHINSTTAKAGPDGRIRIVLASRDPGVANWLDTEGHALGTMLIRCMETRVPHKVETRVLPISSLHIPA